MVHNPLEETATRSKAIIVLGMHRSGTSAVSGLLHILGVDLEQSSVCHLLRQTGRHK